MNKKLALIVILLGLWGLPIVLADFLYLGTVWGLEALFWLIVAILCFLFDYYGKRYEEPLSRKWEIFAILVGFLGLIYTPIIYLLYSVIRDFIIVTYLVFSGIIVAVTRILFNKSN